MMDDELMDLFVTMSITLKAMSDTITTHKRGFDLIIKKLDFLDRKLNEIDAILYNHKETIEKLQKEVESEYRTINKKEKVYVQ